MKTFVVVWMGDECLHFLDEGTCGDRMSAKCLHVGDEDTCWGFFEAKCLHSVDEDTYCRMDVA